MLRWSILFLATFLKTSGENVPGRNCGITVPFRLIRPGEFMKEADIPCTVIYDSAIGQKWKKSIPSEQLQKQKCD